MLFCWTGQSWRPESLCCCNLQNGKMAPRAPESHTAGMNGQRKCGLFIQCNIIQPQKRNGMLSFVTAWVVLSEITQTEEGKYPMIPPACGI